MQADIKADILDRQQRANTGPCALRICAPPFCPRAGLRENGREIAPHMIRDEVFREQAKAARADSLFAPASAGSKPIRSAICSGLLATSWRTPGVEG
jgi:hypothetical protein